MKKIPIARINTFIEAMMQPLLNQFHESNAGNIHIESISSRLMDTEETWEDGRNGNELNAHLILLEEGKYEIIITEGLFYLIMEIILLIDGIERGVLFEGEGISELSRHLEAQAGGNHEQLNPLFLSALLDKQSDLSKIHIGSMIQFFNAHELGHLLSKSPGWVNRATEEIENFKQFVLPIINEAISSLGIRNSGNFTNDIETNIIDWWTDELIADYFGVELMLSASYDFIDIRNAITIPIEFLNLYSQIEISKLIGGIETGYTLRALDNESVGHPPAFLRAQTIAIHPSFSQRLNQNDIDTFESNYKDSLRIYRGINGDAE